MGVLKKKKESSFWCVPNEWKNDNQTLLPSVTPKEVIDSGTDH